jgi:hypothetical protein
MPQIGRGARNNPLVADEVETRRSADGRPDNDNFFVAFRRDYFFGAQHRIIYKVD